MKAFVLPLPLAIALAGCGQTSNDDASTPTGPTATETAAAPVDAPTPTPSDTVGIPEGGIPTALQGNWGMVPGDCTSTRGDAKGLLRVSATTLTFYESVGRLGSIKERSDTSIRADYAFAGEGMEWTRDVSLSVDGDTLTRLDRGGDEPGGPFTYSRCG